MRNLARLYDTFDQRISMKDIILILRERIGNVRIMMTPRHGEGNGPPIYQEELFLPTLEAGRKSAETDFPILASSLLEGKPTALFTKFIKNSKQRSGGRNMHASAINLKKSHPMQP